MLIDIDLVETILKSQLTAHIDLKLTTDKEMDSSLLMETKVVPLITSQIWMLLHITIVNMLKLSNQSVEQLVDSQTLIRTQFMNKLETYTESSQKMKRKLYVAILLNQ